jgi:AraC-like DNA-binding protein
MLEFKLSKLCKNELPIVVETWHAPNYQQIHKHDAIELVYITHGAGWCAVDGVVNPMLTGDLYIIPIGLTHEFYGDPGLEYVNCIFNEDIFKEDELELFKYFNNSKRKELAHKYTFGPFYQNKINTLLKELSEELSSQRQFHSIRARALFINFLVFVIQNTSQAPGIQTNCAQKNLARVLSYINDNLEKKLSLEILSKKSNYTPDYLSKLFKKEIGATPTEFICNRRLEKACVLLEETDLTIEEISYQTGFFDASYFVKVFKKKCAITPAQFRTKVQNKEMSPRELSLLINKISQ